MSDTVFPAIHVVNILYKNVVLIEVTRWNKEDHERNSHISVTDYPYIHA